MDTYVRHFTPGTSNDLSHDIFYLDENIRTSFNDFVQTIVSRYKDEPSVIAWEAANDPRCNSTLPAKTLCNTTTVTHWTANTTTVIKQNDPNHLVSSGDAGFYCVDCTKVFPYNPPAPVPSPGLRKRVEGPLTRAKILSKDAAWKKRNLPPAPKRRGTVGIRGGKWLAPADADVRKRQTNGFGPLYDGTYGVDTEDLSNVPGVDFSSLSVTHIYLFSTHSISYSQYFPDQNGYAPLTTTSTSNFSEVVQSGVDWINQHAQTANT
jgi:mannan endo-1,4-beta-mannosidase